MKTATLTESVSAEEEKSLSVQHLIQRAEECVRESRAMIAEIRARLDEHKRCDAVNKPSETRPKSQVVPSSAEERAVA